MVNPPHPSSNVSVLWLINNRIIRYYWCPKYLIIMVRYNYPNFQYCNINIGLFSKLIVMLSLLYSCFLFDIIPLLLSFISFQTVTKVKLKKNKNYRHRSLKSYNYKESNTEKKNRTNLQNLYEKKISRERKTFFITKLED